METHGDVQRLEEEGWQALSTDAATAADFYGRVLDREVVMLFPHGMMLTDRNAILRSMGGQPWASFRLDDLQVRHPTADTAIVTYGVVAQRDGSEYSALVSSHYVRRDDGWKMAFHQHTPR